MSYSTPDSLFAEYAAAVEQALVAEAKALLSAAKLIVPLDKGPLDNSGEVIVQWVGTVLYVIVGFGGTPETEPYAGIQHENMRYKHAPGRMAKYLEIPAMAATPGMNARVAAYVATKVA